MQSGDPARNFVTQREYERFADATQKRWDDIGVKLDQLTSIVSVEQVRLSSVEKALTLQSSRGFTQSLTAAQVGAGCMISVGVAFLSIFGGVIADIVVHMVTH